MTTRQCNGCKLYYPDMIWSHKVSNCPYCGISISHSTLYEHLTAEEKQAYREFNKEHQDILPILNLSLEKEIKEVRFTISEAIKLYKKYRHDRSLLSDEKRYVIEAYWKYCEKEKDKAMRYVDWLFDYYFSKFESCDKGET